MNDMPPGICITINHGRSTVGVAITAQSPDQVCTINKQE